MAQRRIFSNLQAFLEDLERRNISQSDWAASVGISASFLSDIKVGRYTPSLAMAKKLADAAGVPIESFLSPADSQRT